MGGGMSAKHAFSLVAPVRTFEGVVTQIQEAILDGRLKEGERLASERELCAIFGVSRPTLREGLRWLEAMGLVDIRLGVQGGVYAARPDGDHAGSAIEALIRFHEATASELEEFRASFEGETAQWAAQRADDDDLAELEAIVGEIEQAADGADLPWSVISELDLRFHRALAQASKNRVRIAVMLGVDSAIRRASLSLDPIMSGPERRSIAVELRGVVDALRSRDPELARRRMSAHVQRFSSLEATVSNKGVR
jgi:GntR family transcriptional repressor for pyruvate dehydrogenase complex